MAKDIISNIQDNAAGFSKGQRSIARYITENYDKAAFMTAGRLGKTVGVSESTVVRFATELGYDGYPGMRKAMQEMVRSRLTSVQRIAVARDMLDGSNVLKAVMDSDIDKLQSTLEELDRDSLHRGHALLGGAGQLHGLLHEFPGGKRAQYPRHHRQRGI